MLTIGMPISHKKLGKSFTFLDDTPLVFQWLPKKFGFEDRREIFEEYLIRISNWSKLESQRRIKLIINGAGFEENQKKELKEKISDSEFNPNKNIDIIDFNDLDLSEHDFDFNLSTSHYTLSSYFKNLYSIPEKDRMRFGAEIDIMSKFALLSLKEPVVYFDFDILPHENGNKIGSVTATKGLLVAGCTTATFENSIIATYPGDPLFFHICETIKHKIKTEPQTLTDNSVYKIFNDVLQSLSKEMWSSQLREELSTDEEKRGDPFEASRQVEKQFIFQANGGNVIVTRDRSWENNSRNFILKEHKKAMRKSVIHFTIATVLSALIITAACLTQQYVILAALGVPAIIGIYGWSLYKEEKNIKPDSKLQNGDIALTKSSIAGREAGA